MEKKSGDVKLESLSKTKKMSIIVTPLFKYSFGTPYLL